jgi:YgiT-type zinc finger domain-containing protein
MYLASPYVCPYCGGTLREGRVDFTKLHIGKEVVFKNVLANICQNPKCKEFFMSNLVEQQVTRQVREAPLGVSEVVFE